MTASVEIEGWGMARDARRETRRHAETRARRTNISYLGHIRV